MLMCSNIVFLNCIGSYFYSIFSHLEKSNSNNTLLLYLAASHLEYQRINVEKIRCLYGSNPWGYQPIIIKQNNACLNIDDNFFDYIKNKYSVFVNKIINPSELVANGIINSKEENIFYIFKIDEYFLSYSKMFYMNKHNKHYVLIRGAENNQGIEIIDSEQNKICNITHDELYNAFFKNNFDNKVIYQIDCSKYENNFLNKNNIILINNSKNELDYIRLLHKEICKLEKINQDFEYYYKGIRFSIISKVIPFMEMRKLKLDILKYEELKKLATDILIMWKSLGSFMLYKYNKNELSLFSVIKRLEEIYCAELKLKEYVNKMEFIT